MNYKIILATLLAAGLAGSASAQRQLSAAEVKDNLTDPDFLIRVPLDLKDIPGELYEAVVWCEVRDNRGNVIAETGGVSVPVEGHQACGAVTAGTDGAGRGAAPCPGMSTYKKPEKWSASKIWGTQSAQLKAGQGRGQVKGDVDKKGDVKGDVKTVPPDTFFIGDKNPGPGWGPFPGVILRASTPGAVNPATGTGYTCHIGFKADVLIDGRHQNITVFGLDPGTLKTIPSKERVQKDVSGRLEGKPGEMEFGTATGETGK